MVPKAVVGKLIFYFIIQLCIRHFESYKYLKHLNVNILYGANPIDFCSDVRYSDPHCTAKIQRITNNYPRLLPPNFGAQDMLPFNFNFFNFSKVKTKF